MERKTVLAFSLNYRINIGDKWIAVYRVDTFHGPLHEHRFWLREHRRKLDHLLHLPLNLVVDMYIKEIKENFRKYREYYEYAKKP